MWNVQGSPDAVAKFSPFHPEHVLYEFDGPRIFTLRDVQGELYLVYWSDESPDEARYIVVPTSNRIINSLREGGMSVLEALNQPRSWVCEVDHEDTITKCLRVDFDAIPRDALPTPGTMLWPTREPLLTARTAPSGDHSLSAVSAQPRPKSDLREVQMRQRHKGGVAAIFGKWPGEESDEVLLKALEDLD